MRSVWDKNAYGNTLKNIKGYESLENAVNSVGKHLSEDIKLYPVEVKDVGGKAFDVGLQLLAPPHHTVTGNRAKLKRSDCEYRPPR